MFVLYDVKVGLYGIGVGVGLNSVVIGLYVDSVAL